MIFFDAELAEIGDQTVAEVVRVESRTDQEQQREAVPPPAMVWISEWVASIVGSPSLDQHRSNLIGCDGIEDYG